MQFDWQRRFIPDTTGILCQRCSHFYPDLPSCAAAVVLMLLARQLLLQRAIHHCSCSSSSSVNWTFLGSWCPKRSLESSEWVEWGAAATKWRLSSPWPTSLCLGAWEHDEVLHRNFLSGWKGFIACFLGNTCTCTKAFLPPLDLHLVNLQKFAPCIDRTHWPLGASSSIHY